MEKMIDIELIDTLFEELNAKVDTSKVEFADASCGGSSGGCGGCTIATGGKW